MEQGLINFFVNDTIDYIQMKEDVSMNGMVSAIKGFAYKCGSTLTSSGILAITCVILIICLIFNPIEPHREKINVMKEKMQVVVKE